MADPSFDYDNVAKDVIDDLVCTDHAHCLRNVTKDDTVLPLDACGGSKWSQLHNVAMSSHNNNSNYLNHPNMRTRTRRKLTDFHYLNYHGASSFSIIDKDRNALSMTSAMNTTFGSGVASPSTGVVFNRDVDDFSSHGVTNAFGLQPSESNYVKPNKRPLSSMSPAWIFHSSSASSPVDNSNDKLDKLFMALGSSGGPKIISAVLQTWKGLWFGASNLRIDFG